MSGLSREELLEIRDQIIRGSPPYTKDSIGTLKRVGGVPGLDERKAMGDYDTNASGVRMALEICLKLVQHSLDRAKK
jgi:hypothetical protein